jgi:hypothetical protein
MRMHVDHAGEAGEAAKVDHFGAGRNRAFRLHTADLSVFHYNDCVVHHTMAVPQLPKPDCPDRFSAL